MSKKALLIIKWKDAAADGSWTDVEAFHAPAICYSVGWAWKEDDEGITLAANYSPNDTAHKDHSTGNLQYILKSTIVERKIIHRAEK